MNEQRKDTVRLGRGATTDTLVERLRESQRLYEWAGVDGSEGALQAKEAADALEAAKARIAELERECARRAALVPIAYGEGILDVSARGATLENASEKYGTCDSKAALDDAEVHRAEWPDNHDDALNSVDARTALEAKG